MFDVRWMNTKHFGNLQCPKVLLLLLIFHTSLRGILDEIKCTNIQTNKKTTFVLVMIWCSAREQNLRIFLSIVTLELNYSQNYEEKDG